MIKIFIVTDLEGISGIKHISQVTDTDKPEYMYSRERLMADTNAAIAGAFEGGADEVYVEDGHGRGDNFIEGALDSRAVRCPITGKDAPDFNEISAFMHVGAHAMAGTQCAFLDHTQSSVSWHDYIVNGRPSGELVQSGLLAGAYNIPYIFVSGDEAACAEGRRFFGDISTAAVKYAVKRNEAICMPDDEALELIRRKAKESISLINKIRPYRVTMPMELKLVLNRCDYCDNIVSYRKDVDRLDARTVRRVVNKIETYYDVLF